MIINAEGLINIVWGGRWNDSIPIFKILGIAFIFQPILNTTGPIFLVRNRTHWLFRWNLFSTSIVIISIIVGVKYGVIGVSISLALASLILIAPLVFIVYVKLLDSSIMNFIYCIKNGLYLAIVVGVFNLILIKIVNNMYYGFLINIIITAIITIVFLQKVYNLKYSETMILLREIKHTIAN